MTPPKFDVTAEREGSILGFLSRQWNLVPEAITDVNLAGKTAVIVGANCGVGLEVACQFLNLGLSTLIIGARSEEKATAAIADLKHTCGDQASIQTWSVDLAWYDSVVAFARRAKSLDRMDYVVLNAGMCTNFRTNKSTGHEETIQTNYLSLALLTALLLPVAKATLGAQGGAPTRITFTSSDVASWTSFKEKSPTCPYFGL